MASAINIYSYTAASNPYFVKCIAHKYGYTYDKGQNLGSVLQQLVAMEGEPVLMEIIENNPDKDLFFDYYQKKFPQEEKKDVQNIPNVMDYMNFSGQVQAQNIAENKKITAETSTMLLAGAVIIALAIISTNYKR
jgi:hypothetical protein